jgi:hypothetical protein
MTTSVIDPPIALICENDVVPISSSQLLVHLGPNELKVFMMRGEEWDFSCNLLMVSLCCENLPDARY